MSSSSAIFTAIGFLTPWRLLCDFFNDLLCCCCCFFLVDVVVCHSPWAANLLPPTGRRPGAVLRPSSSDGGGSRLTLTGDDQSTTFSSSAKTKSLSSYRKCIERKRVFSCCFLSLSRSEKRFVSKSRKEGDDKTRPSGAIDVYTW